MRQRVQIDAEGRRITHTEERGHDAGTGRDSGCTSTRFPCVVSFRFVHCTAPVACDAAPRARVMTRRSATRRRRQESQHNREEERKADKYSGQREMPAPVPSSSSCLLRLRACTDLPSDADMRDTRRSAARTGHACNSHGGAQAHTHTHPPVLVCSLLTLFVSSVCVSASRRPLLPAGCGGGRGGVTCTHPRPPFLPRPARTRHNSTPARIHEGTHGQGGTHWKGEEGEAVQPALCVHDIGPFHTRPSWLESARCGRRERQETNKAGLTLFCV